VPGTSSPPRGALTNCWSARVRNKSVFRWRQYAGIVKHLENMAMHRFLAASLVVVSVVFFSGCSTLADAQAAKGSGKAKIYDRAYDDVWLAVVETVKSSGLSLESENKENGTLLAHGSISAFSWGENVAVFVEGVDGQARTRVEVMNKRVLATNITAKDWASRLFVALDERLE